MATPRVDTATHGVEYRILSMLVSAHGGYPVMNPSTNPTTTKGRNRRSLRSIARQTVRILRLHGLVIDCMGLLEPSRV